MGVLKVPRDAPARQVVEHPGDRCAPYAVHGAQRSQHERAHVHLGRREKQGAATSLDGGGDGKADLMRGLSSRSSCGGACDSSSTVGGTLSKGGSLDAVQGGVYQRVDDAMTV